MESPRDQFLAGARLAGDQHGEVRSAEPPDRTEHLLHRGRRADDSRCVRGDRLVEVEGLRQVLVRTALVGGHRTVEIRIAGHDDHREMRIAGRDLTEQIQSVNVGHADVGDNRVRLAQPQARVDAGSAFESLHRESGATDQFSTHNVVVEVLPVGSMPFSHLGIINGLER